jgi:uncharacterized Fe-S radical SAM superfamily protein PflX
VTCCPTWQCKGARRRRPHDRSQYVRNVEVVGSSPITSTAFVLWRSVFKREEVPVVWDSFELVHSAARQ